MKARWRSVDPLVFAVGGVALLTYALHGFNGMLTRDLAVYSYAGQQVAEGVPPYLGILNRAGPLAHVIPGIGVVIARIGGFDDLFTLRLLFLAIATLCVCAVYVLGRDVFASTARRARHGVRVPHLLRVHRVRVQRPAREDPDDAVHRTRPLGGREETLVHGRVVRQPGDPVPADRLLQLVRSSGGGGALPRARRADSSRWSGWLSAAPCPSLCWRSGSRSRDRCASRSTPSC